MKKLYKNDYGFGAVELLVIIIVLVAIGFIGWKAYSKVSSNQTNQELPSNSKGKEEGLIWRQTEKGWEAMSPAPDCPSQPMLKPPANLNDVTSILYPGQTRGGNYKPHGGFRFDNAQNNSAVVTAPIDGYIVKGSRYLAEGTSEIQYTFDVINNCGIMYRLGHLRELPANLQKIVDEFPSASYDSRLYSVEPAVFIEQGDTVATKVGLTSSGNTFFDFGVYDLRQENMASKSTSYQSNHSQDKELSWHAVCWLSDWLPEESSSKITTLPAGDPESGKNSDYCK